MSTNQIKNQHLLWRAGFGPSADDVSSLATLSTKSLFTSILHASKEKPVYIDVAKNILDGFVMGVGDVVNMQQAKREMQDEDNKRQFQRKSREAIRSLNLTWLNEMVNSKAQLREKISFFWHGHFACRNLNIYFQQLLLDEIRNNALGNFKDLLLSVSKSAAMLAFLNNQQNKKLHPNENFAREVMELFTLGRGNYTETDVKEAARAFTGWSFNPKGEFVFRKFQHDSGSKTFLGKTGNFTGEDVIDILLEQKQTAYFVCKKLYKFFVNEVADEEHVKYLADRFYNSGYNIADLTEDIFTSKWFYADKNIGAKIKSPIELLAGIRRMIPMELENDEVQLLMQRSLGQMLFYPPNVAGWPGGKNWIDSSSLVLRMRIPQLIKDNEVFNITPKADDDQGMGMMDKVAGYNKTEMNAIKQNERFRINANVNWEKYVQLFEKIPREQLYKGMETLVLQTKAGQINSSIVDQRADKSSREKYIQSISIALMSTPEYQLC